MGVAPPRQGRIRFARRRDRGARPHEIARRGIAWVPEERRVLPNLTVHENLRLAMLGAGARDGADTLMDEVFEFFPRLQRAARLSRPLPLRRRAADARHRPRRSSRGRS